VRVPGSEGEIAFFLTHVLQGSRAFMPCTILNYSDLPQVVIRRIKSLRRQDSQTRPSRISTSLLLSLARDGL